MIPSCAKARGISTRFLKIKVYFPKREAATEVGGKRNKWRPDDVVSALSKVSEIGHGPD